MDNTNSAGASRKPHLGPLLPVKRKTRRDRKVAALSLELLPQPVQRSARSLSQALLAGELHDAIILCLENALVMPTPALLRSLIDTCVLGLWLLKYATDEEVCDSVSRLSTTKLVKERFVDKDRKMFAFVFQPIAGTDHEFYRDVLHPAIHGDALHIAMRLRDTQSKKTWVHKCVFHTNQVYAHFLLQFAQTGQVPLTLRTYVKQEAARSKNLMTTLLQHPDFQGEDQHLSE